MVAGNCDGRLETYLLQEMLGSEQIKDKNILNLSYSGVFYKGGAHNYGFDIGHFKVDDTKSKKYRTTLKHRFKGSPSNCKFQGKMSYIGLPFIRREESG